MPKSSKKPRDTAKDSQESTQEKSNEQLFAEIDGYLTTIQEMRFPTIYRDLRSVRRLCLGVQRLSDELQKRLGMFEEAKK